jgi:hypothetical protein
MKKGRLRETTPLRPLSTGFKFHEGLTAQVHMKTGFLQPVGALPLRFDASQKIGKNIYAIFSRSQNCPRLP